MKRRNKAIAKQHEDVEGIGIEIENAVAALKQRLVDDSGSQVKAANRVKALEKSISSMSDLELLCYQPFLYAASSIGGPYSRNRALDRALCAASGSCNLEVTRRNLRSMENHLAVDETGAVCVWDTRTRRYYELTVG